VPRFYLSHFCEPNRRAALPSASSVAALHFLVTSLVYQICSIPLVSRPHSSQHRWPLDAVSPRDTLVASDPKKGLSAGLGTQPRQAATFAFCLVFGVIVFLFPIFPFFIFIFIFFFSASGDRGHRAWAGLLPYPPLFRFYPHGSAAISRNGARRALIGAARMAVRSRERRVAYDSAGPNPSTLGDLTWREGVFRQPVVPARQCTSWGPGRVMALVVQGRGGDTPLPNSAVGANVVSYSAGRSRCFSELLPAGA
jgi:hypothetical protein